MSTQTSFTHFTDEELVSRVRTLDSLSELELELVTRLERALDEIDELEIATLARAGIDSGEADVTLQ